MLLSVFIRGFITIIIPNYFFLELVKASDITIPEFQNSQVAPSSSHPDIIDKIEPSHLSQLESNSKKMELESIEKPKRNHKEEILLDALSVSASKYPWLVNPSDRLTFYPQLFKPNINKNYFDFDIRFAKDNPIINKFTFAYFPQKEQFYWVLPNNRVVFETQAWQGGILYQGKSTRTEMTQAITLEQAFGGFQSVALIPDNFEGLTGEVKIEDFSIISTIGQITNPPGIPADKVIINSDRISEIDHATVLKNPIPNLGSGSTKSLNGGGSLFKSLDVSNTPLILQGFPTVDLRPLLNNGNVKLAEREVISREVLEAAGISWGDIVTGKPSQFTAPITSLPGIKVGQAGKFDNADLLNTLVNPFQTNVERNLHYLNSLFWVSFGQRQPKFNVSVQHQEEDDWHRLYFSHAHNRTIIDYNSVELSASYANVFANPGISLIVNLDDGKINSNQSANSTLGLALGLVFEKFDINNLQQHLDDAKQRFKSGEEFATLETKATSLQRRQINYRLNRTLSDANSVSSLKQVSGTITFPSKITPKNSSIIQVRTGLYQRGLQFLQEDRSSLIEGNTFFSKLKLSNKDFGMLTFISTPLPLEATSVTPINESIASEVILVHPNGKSFSQQFDSAETTIAPIGIKSSDLAFDRIELTRVDHQNISFSSFNGYLYLPAVELILSGSKSDFHYSMSSGVWLNLDSNSAPSVSNNNIGLQEPIVGFYASALLDFQKINVERDIKNEPKAIQTYTSFLNVNWNSKSNRINPFSANLNYSYSYQNKSFGFSITPGIAFIESNSNGKWTGFLTGQFSTRTGLECNFNTEIGKAKFFDISVLQRVTPTISIGAYLKNFSQINIGLDSRVSNLNYGFILKQSFTNNSFLEAQLGMGERGFDTRFQGGLGF